MTKEQRKHFVKRFSNYELMGSYLKRFSVLYISLLFVIAFFEVALFTKEIALPHSNSFRHIAYIISYIVLFVTSVSSALFVLSQRKVAHSEKRIALVIHIYALIALMWGTCVSLLDAMGDTEFPVVFFTILATISGLLVLNPFIYLPLMFLFDVGMVLGIYFINPDLLGAANIINMVVLFTMILIISYRTTAVAVSDEDQRKQITAMSMTDVLTGLKNENAYYKYLDKLDSREDKKHFEYAVIVMDCNGLKHIDDTYGHRFGAHVISTAGKLLPKVFENSEIFHTGGDEFVCIVEKEFYRLGELLDKFENTLEYHEIYFENQKLILSLSYGVAVHKDNEKYNNTYQRADRDMYKNKPEIKAKYNIQGR